VPLLSSSPSRHFALARRSSSFIFNLIYKPFKRRACPAEPVGRDDARVEYSFSSTLNNFGGKHPVIYHDPYSI